MKKENKKKITVLIIVAVALILVTIALSLLLNFNKKGDKIFSSKDYIIEKETEYSDKQGLLPFINLKGDEIDQINNEILYNYYSAAGNEIDQFRYEYYMYKNILSIFVITTHYDNTEYGDIQYYSYNINVEQNRVLSNNELYNYLNIEKTEISDIIDERINKYFKQDNLSQEITYEEYKNVIDFNEENIKIVLKEQKLYCYYVFGLTKSLTEYEGNINEIELKYLD